MTEDWRTEEGRRGQEEPRHTEQHLGYEGEALRLQAGKCTVHGQEPNRAAGSPGSCP